MKLNTDLIRDLLICFEAIGYDEIFVIESNLEVHPINSYSLDEILYHVSQMDKSNLIEIAQYADGVTCVSDLTPYGHEFLANIRDDNIWKGTKEVTKKVGCKSLDALTQISSNIISQIIKSQFGLI